MTCSHCQKEYPRELLMIHSHRDMVSGEKKNYFHCRKCNTKRLKKYRATPNGKKHTQEAVYRSMKKWNKRQNARAYLFQAVKKGKIIRPKFCEACGEIGKVFAHHEDYSKPLQVNWLCRDCHSLKHKKL